MSDKDAVVVTLPADVQQIDQTGYVWALLDQAIDELRHAHLLPQ